MLTTAKQYWGDPIDCVIEGVPAGRNSIDTISLHTTLERLKIDCFIEGVPAGRNNIDTIRLHTTLERLKINCFIEGVPAGRNSIDTIRLHTALERGKIEFSKILNSRLYYRFASSLQGLSPYR